MSIQRDALLYTGAPSRAGMAELVDAPDSKSGMGNHVGVRVPPRHQGLFRRSPLMSKKRQHSIGRNVPLSKVSRAKVSGAWVLKNTRMPVSAIFENLEVGANIDDIIEWCGGLDREQVKSVIEFAARSLDTAPTNSPYVKILFDQTVPVPLRPDLHCGPWSATMANPSQPC